MTKVELRYASERGVVALIGYIVRCGCNCGCDAAFHQAGNGDAYIHQRPLFDQAVVAAGWTLAPWGPRWVCERCGGEFPACKEVKGAARTDAD